MSRFFALLAGVLLASNLFIVHASAQSKPVRLAQANSAGALGKLSEGDLRQRLKVLQGVIRDKKRSNAERAVARRDLGATRKELARRAGSPGNARPQRAKRQPDDARKRRRQAREKDAKQRAQKAKTLANERKQQLEERQNKARAEAIKRKAQEQKRKVEADRRKREAGNRKRQADQKRRVDEQRKAQAGKQRAPGSKSQPNPRDVAAARKVLSDARPARALSDGALGRRVNATRNALGRPNLPGNLAQKLRRRLAQDSAAMRDRKGPPQADRRRKPRNERRAPDSRNRPNPRDVAAARKTLADTRPARALSDGALGRRVDATRDALSKPNLPGDLTQRLRRRLAQDVAAVRRRKGPSEADRRRPRDERIDRAPAEQRRARERRRRARDDRDRPGPGIIAEGREALADVRPASALNDGALSRRLQKTRRILRRSGLPPRLSRRLRRRLAADRRELRDRVAARNERRERAQERAERNRDRDRAERRRDRDRARERRGDFTLAGLLRDRRPGRRLGQRELARRIRATRDALARRRLRRRDRVYLARLLADDRAVFRNRLRSRRARRQRELARDRARLRERFARRPGVRFERRPDIAAAEADGGIIERQLIAPPVRELRRKYSMRDIRRDPDLRLAMPALEIDTIRFAFNSAEIAPEEVAKLERVGAIIERILIGRPGEVYLIEGHTDAPGSFEYNQELSQRRAEAVRAALLEYFVIRRESVEVAGFGEDYPRVRTPDPEPENRRVTLRRLTPLLRGSGGGGG